MNARELRTYLPIMAIRDGAVLSKRGDVTFGWALTLPVSYTVNEAGYDSIIHSFLQVYKLLPVYTVVHKQDIFCYETYHASRKEHFLPDSYEKHFEGRKYLSGRSYLYLTFSSKSNIERKNSESGFFGVSGLKWASPEHLNECAAYASQFEAVLKNNGLIGVRALTNEDFLHMGTYGEDTGTIADYLRMYRQDGPDYNFDFQPSFLGYGDERMHVWYVEDSDAYSSLVSSVSKIHGMSSGAAQVFLSGGSPIGVRLRLPHIVNRYVLTLPRATVESELDTKRRSMQAFSLYSAKDGVNSQEIGEYLLASARDSATTVKCYMNVMAWGTPSEIPDIRNSVVTAFHSELQVAVVEETRVVPVLHYAAIPGAEAELGYDNYLTSEITAFCCHGLWDGYDRGIPGGLIQLCDRETMTPVTIDIQQVARNLGYINAMNAIVVGPTGSGKSFLMNKLVQDFYEAGQHIFIIDVGDSYQGYAQIVAEESGGVDGVYNTYDPQHPYGFNPFRNYRQWNEVDSEGETVNSGYDFFMSLLKTIHHIPEGWSTQSTSALKHLVTLFLRWWSEGVPENVSEELMEAHMNWRRERMEKNNKKYDDEKLKLGFRNPVDEIFSSEKVASDPLFDDFYQFITRIVGPLVRDGNFRMGDIPFTSRLLDIDAFSASMDLYQKDGMYGFLLNAKDEPDLFKSRLTVFEVDKIKDNKQVFPIWVLLIMHSFEDKMRSLPCQKVMIIEEAWKAIATESMAEFIIWMWRTARKFSTSAFVVTQDILDLTGSSVIRDAIIVNSPVKILLDQRDNVTNFEKGADVLGYSREERNLVLSVGSALHPGYGKYKEAFFSIGPNYKNVFAIEVSPQQALAFESNKDDKRPIMQRAKECGSIIRAIQENAPTKKQR